MKLSSTLILAQLAPAAVSALWYDSPLVFRHDDFTAASCHPRDALEVVNDYISNNRSSFLVKSRDMYASSPYPCERLEWFYHECGVYALGFHPTFWGHRNERQCFCENSDYWVLVDGCLACYEHFSQKESDFSAHSGGNKTRDKELRDGFSNISESLCHPTPQMLPSSMYNFMTVVFPTPTQVADGIGHSFDSRLVSTENYWTATRDLVPAYIQEPTFTRTVDGTTITMTPGIQHAGPLSPTGDDDQLAITSATGAANLLPAPSNVAMAFFGAALML